MKMGETGQKTGDMKHPPLGTARPAPPRKAADASVRGRGGEKGRPPKTQLLSNLVHHCASPFTAAVPEAPLRVEWARWHLLKARRSLTVLMRRRTARKRVYVRYRTSNERG